MNKVIVRVIVFTIVFLVFFQYAVVLAGTNVATISNVSDWKALKIVDEDNVNREMVYKYHYNETDNNVKYGTLMQFFDIGSDGSIYRTSTFGEHLLYVDKMKNGKLETMKLNYFGHGQGFSVDKNGYIYLSSLNCEFLNKKGEDVNKSLGISYLKFEDGKELNYTAGITYILPKKNEIDYDNISYSELRISLRPILDEENGYFALRDANSSNNLWIYNLNDVKNLAKHKATITDYKVGNKNGITLYVCNLNDIKPIKKMDMKPYQAGLPIQGLDIYGDKLYILKGVGYNTTKKDNDLKTHNCANIIVVDWKNNQVIETTSSIAENMTKEVYDSNSTLDKKINSYAVGNNLKARFEAEGIQVKNGRVYAGFATSNYREQNNKRLYKSFTILYTETSNEVIKMENVPNISVSYAVNRVILNIKDSNGIFAKDIKIYKINKNGKKEELNNSKVLPSAIINKEDKKNLQYSFALTENVLTDVSNQLYIEVKNANGVYTKQYIRIRKNTDGSYKKNIAPWTKNWTLFNKSIIKFTVYNGGIIKKVIVKDLNNSGKVVLEKENLNSKTELQLNVNELKDNNGIYNLEVYEEDMQSQSRTDNIVFKI